MSRYFFRLFIVVLLGISLFVGCRKHSSVPEDFPTIFSCVITVIQEGKPLQGAIVTLFPVDSPGKYNHACSAKTDAAGNAAIRTYGQPGVPPGKYTITIEKLQEEGGREVFDEELGGRKVVGQKTFSYVDAIYRNKETTPFAIEVKSGPNNLTCDVGKSVRKQL